MKKLKLGYFTHTNISCSETFIYDLVKSLKNDTNINITFISGNSKKINVDFDLNYISTGFYSKHKKISYWLYKIGQVLGGKGYNFKSWFQKKNSLRQLNKHKISNFDIAYVEYGVSGVLLLEYFKLHNIPCILHVHGNDVTAATNDPEYKSNLLSLYSYCRYIITPSNYIKNVLVLQGCKPEKIHPIYPFETKSVFKNTTFKDRYSRNPNITFLGRLTAKKNPIALLYAFAIVQKHHTNVILNIMGDGELMNVCKQKANELDIENNVNFYGVVKRKFAFEILSNSWIYTQHSITTLSGDQEGFPVSLAEAAAHSLPLISTIHSGITENIIDGVTGFLVQENDYEKMAEKLIYLIENPDKAETMGKAALEHISEICPSNSRANKIKELVFSATE